MKDDKEWDNKSNIPLNNISGSIIGLYLFIYNVIVFLTRILPAMLLTYILGIIFPQIYTVSIFSVLDMNNFWMISIYIFAIITGLKTKGSYLTNSKPIIENMK